MRYVFCEEGALFPSCAEKAGTGNVLACVTDTEERIGQEALPGLAWQGLEVLPGLDYDFLVLFRLPGSPAELEAVDKRLLALGVPEEKRVYAPYFLGYQRTDLFYSCHGERKLMEALGQLQASSLLDYDMYLAEGAQLSRRGMVTAPYGGLRICGRQRGTSRLPRLRRAFYDELYEEAEPEGRFSAALFARGRSPEEQEAILRGKGCGFTARFYIFPVRAASLEEAGKALLKRFARYGNLAFKGSPGWSWLIVDTWARRQLSIYVVTHKRFREMAPPGVYRTIEAGAAIRGGLGFQQDDKGDNISALNPYLNELTALYWIWRHDRSDFVGLSHYRRYFMQDGSGYHSGNILTAARALQMLQGCDILLGTIFEQEYLMMQAWIRWDVGEQAFLEADSAVRELLAERQPDYLSSYLRVMHGNAFYRFNMFVAHRPVMEAYCEWLFSFLPEAVARLRPERFEGAARRVLGYIGERMLTVWLLRQELRVRELPIAEIEPLGQEPGSGE